MPVELVLKSVLVIFVLRIILLFFGVFYYYFFSFFFLIERLVRRHMSFVADLRFLAFLNLIFYYYSYSIFIANKRFDSDTWEKCLSFHIKFMLAADLSEHPNMGLSFLSMSALST